MNIDVLTYAPLRDLDLARSAMFVGVPTYIEFLTKQLTQIIAIQDEELRDDYMYTFEYEARDAVKYYPQYVSAQFLNNFEELYGG